MFYTYICLNYFNIYSNHIVPLKLKIVKKSNIPRSLLLKSL